MNDSLRFDFRPRYYILEGHNAVMVPDVLTWARWFETAHEDRIVARTHITESVEVSTVFLGLDHSWRGGEPMIFETMIFGGPKDQYQTRCSTWAQALQMHADALLAATLDRGGEPK